MIGEGYRVRVTVSDCGNSVYALENTCVLPAGLCRGDRLGLCEAFVNDVLICAREQGHDVSPDWREARVCPGDGCAIVCVFLS